MELQVLWFSSSKPPYPPLFSVATRHPKYASSPVSIPSQAVRVSVTWAAFSEVRTLDACPIPLPLLKEKSLVVLFLLIVPSCATYSKPTQTLLCFQHPQASKLCQFYQHSEWGKTKNSHLGNALKRCTAGFILFPWGRNRELGCLLPPVSCAGLGERLMQVKWNCSYQLFLTLCPPGVLQFLNWILEFS